MEHVQQTNVGAFLRARRLELGMSLQDVAVRAGLNKSSVQRLEEGHHQTAKPETLVRLAHAVGVSSGDLFALAGLSQPSQLPTLRPYLRLKYGDLPDAAMAEIEAYLAAVAQHYGVGPHGPMDGEDEQ